MSRNAQARCWRIYPTKCGQVRLIFISSRTRKNNPRDEHILINNPHATNTLLYLVKANTIFIRAFLICTHSTDIVTLSLSQSFHHMCVASDGRKLNTIIHLETDNTTSSRYAY
jgi:hypothetical protein